MGYPSAGSSLEDSNGPADLEPERKPAERVMEEEGGHFQVWLTHRAQAEDWIWEYPRKHVTKGAIVNSLGLPLGIWLCLCSQCPRGRIHS